MGAAMVEAGVAVKALLQGAAPERKQEIEDLWNRYTPKVCVVEDARGVNISAGNGRIQFDHKTLEAIWLLGFNGWRSIETYSPAIILAGITGGALEDILRADDELAAFEMDYRSRANSARSIIEEQSSIHVTWPQDVPRPESERNALNNHQEMAAFDLVCLATAYVFLHELRHVKFLSDGDCPTDRREEEIACDVWARSFLTDKVGSYAQSVGQAFSRVLDKRSMGIALGAMILHEITPESARWGTAEYPPITVRIQAMISGSTLAKESHFWLFTACLLVGIFRQAHRQLPMYAPSTHELVEQLITDLQP
ncbi:phage exclusion protein Lit family protein [Methylococcus capsulatus]|uniref:Peptidase U49, Lit peptidase n=1 Tax=Methylococcus capsulatus TaxID=414 RepID=A0AA35Y0E1_METCP|nr:phage exclusion protein Lit family protein [Methylococcus capsulatus]CAI8817139.1 Peptidase U49, Lit peptidase [Methylococcus capsulatus]